MFAGSHSSLPAVVIVMAPGVKVVAGERNVDRNEVQVRLAGLLIVLGGGLGDVEVDQPLAAAAAHGQVDLTSVPAELGYGAARRYSFLVPTSGADRALAVEHLIHGGVDVPAVSPSGSFISARVLDAR
jgi:hypothetical protein